VAERANPVVVGIDGSDHSLVALRAAIDEARRRDADLHVVYITDFTPAVLHLPGEVTVNTADVAEARRLEVWQTAEPIIDSLPFAKRIDLGGYPADALAGYCDEVGAGLLVLGNRGRGRLASTFLGSTSLRALERAHCDVLIVKGNEESG
jgi:nucleotide-binding universal stress UspA family protein